MRWICCFQWNLTPRRFVSTGKFTKNSIGTKMLCNVYFIAQKLYFYLKENSYDNRCNCIYTQWNLLTFVSSLSHSQIFNCSWYKNFHRNKFDIHMWPNQQRCVKCNEAGIVWLGELSSHVFTYTHTHTLSPHDLNAV